MFIRKYSTMPAAQCQRENLMVYFKPPMSNEEHLVEIYNSNNKADVTAKQGILESNGIACSVKKETDQRFGSAWGMPIGMEDSMRRFRLLVSPENAGHAEEILATAPSEEFPHPRIILLDREHNAAVSASGNAPAGGDGTAVFPTEAIDEAADHRQFTFVGEYAGEREELYQFFISPREAASIRLEDGYAWKSLRSILSLHNRGTAEPGSPFRTAYCKVLLGGYDPPVETFGAFGFGSTPKQADRLCSLVRDGTKRATAGLEWTYDAEGEPRPEPGDVSVVTDGEGNPGAVIETVEVEMVPFNEVPEGFAALEGEGDKSLEYWRKVHWKFFRKECRKLGREPSDSMPVVCERFRVLHVL